MSQTFIGKIYGMVQGKFISKGQELTWLEFTLGTRSIKNKIQKKDAENNPLFEIARDATGNALIAADGNVVTVPVMVAGRKFTKVKAYGSTADFIVKYYKDSDQINFFGSLEDEEYWAIQRDENGNPVYEIQENADGTLAYVLDEKSERIEKKRLIKQTVIYVERINLA